ncbi:hypothetical protein L3Y34_008729 [Caenorhabditis briggsae]|uniref:SGNH domain-containing protein n=1 Tax=Caenorhabditis briggsae TaxID=6238 RepID=A0AAE9A3W6_CAEBR|nr:hypothetical protein L3Y34_008729 [Caenorhabditis briggsae]
MRTDIQCLRGIAIIFVLSFHLAPNLFVNGFLGVDIFVKKIYILDALPEYSENFFTLFLHYLITRPEDMELLHLNKKKADLDMKNVRKRLRMIKCTKCELFDLSHLFVENDKYLTFDRENMMSYVDNSVHLTTAGVAPCDPIFKNITKEILNKF